MAKTLNRFDEVLHALNAAILRNDKDEPMDLKALRTGNISIGVGGQFGSTWEFVWGLLRDLPMGAWYPLVQFCDRGRSSNRHSDLYLYTNEQIIDQMVTLNQPYIPFLRYVGFIEMANMFDAGIKFAPTATRDELRLFANAFLRYLNRYTSYALFYFDWKILGDKYIYNISPACTLPTAPPNTITSSLGSRPVHITSGPKIKLSWNKLGITVYAHIATIENPALCGDFLKILPFEALHLHVLVSGRLSYAWAPLVSIASAPVKERLSEAPVGRLFFSQSTGMKVMLKYGAVDEDLEQPVLGEILPQYHGLLAQLGYSLWKSTYETKKEIKVRFELAEDGQEGLSNRCRL